MDRLTFEGNFCDIAMCYETPGGSFCEDGYCSQRKCWERLKQYEDTGLEPEEIRALVDGRKPLAGADFDGNVYAICPECCAIVEDGEWRASYCPDCGQKIDWGGESGK